MLVSVIIPIYKNHHFLSKSLESVVNQSYKNIEILIINDGDDDDNRIVKIINSFSKKKIIKYFKLKKNFGVSYALNYGIKKSKGKYINWLSHDDFFHENKIQLQMDIIKKKNSLICYSSFFLVDKKEKILSLKKCKMKMFKPFIHIIIRDNLNMCTFLINRKIFNDIGLFDNNLKHTQDYDMMFRIFKKHNPFYLDIPLFYSRSHNMQTSKTQNIFADKEKKIFNESKFSILILEFSKQSFIKKIIIIFFLCNRNMNGTINNILFELKKKNLIIFSLLRIILFFFTLYKLIK